MGTVNGQTCIAGHAGLSVDRASRAMARAPLCGQHGVDETGACGDRYYSWPNLSSSPPSLS